MAEKEKEAETLIKIDEDEEEEFLSWFEKDANRALKDVTFLLGKGQNEEDDEEKNANTKIFHLDRIIKKDKEKRTALRILIEDSDDGIVLAKAALDKSKDFKKSLDAETNHQLIRDITHMIFPPPEICYLDCNAILKKDMYEIGNHDVIKQIAENSFDIQLREKIWVSKRKGHRDLQKFLLKEGCLGKIAYLKNKDKSNPNNDEGPFDPYTTDGRTLFRILLEDVINGHKLVMVMLNNLVDKAPPDEDESSCSKCSDINQEDAFIRLHLQPLWTDGDQMKIVYDILDIQSQRGGAENFRDIFNHPIIQTYILTKWDRVNMNFAIRIRLFALFVFLFTAFIRIKIIEFSKNTTDKWFLLSCFNEESNNTTNNTANNAINNTAYNATNNTANEYMVYLHPEIFGKNKRNVYVISIILAVLLLWQVLGLLWKIYNVCRSGSKKNKIGKAETGDQKQNIDTYRERDRQRNLFISFVNVVVFSLGIISCMLPCLLSIVLFLLWCYLVVREVLQFCALVIHPVWVGQGNWEDFFKQLFKMNYWNDPENYIEIIVLACVPIALFFEITGEDRRAEILRGIVAGGVCCAWIEFIFILGMPSTSYLGDFITMFYNVLKIKLWTYMQIFLLLTTGFGFAFWILDEGYSAKQNEDDEKSDVISFKGFWLSQILSIAKSAGELNVGDVYKNFHNQTITLIFAMVLIVFLIIISSIAMLNLLVAAIISDYNEMESEVDYQSMIFMAEYAIQIELYRNIMLHTPLSRLAKYLKKRSWIPKSLDYCPHEMCNKKHKNYESNCKLMPLPMIRPEDPRINVAGEGRKKKAVLQKLIALRNRNLKKEEEGLKEEGRLCEYHESMEE